MQQCADALRTGQVDAVATGNSILSGIDVQALTVSRVTWNRRRWTSPAWLDVGALLGLSTDPTHIRALLAEHGVPNAKIDYRNRFDTWSLDKIAEVSDPPSTRVLRSYLRWHLAHKLDACSEGRFRASKHAVIVAVKFPQIPCNTINFIRGSLAGRCRPLYRRGT